MSNILLRRRARRLYESSRRYYALLDNEPFLGETDIDYEGPEKGLESLEQDEDALVTITIPIETIEANGIDVDDFIDETYEYFNLDKSLEETDLDDIEEFINDLDRTTDITIVPTDASIDITIPENRVSEVREFLEYMGFDDESIDEVLLEEDLEEDEI